MSNNVFTEKQKEIVSDLKRSRLRRLDILEGSVRSGKTWISLVIWALWIGTMPKDGRFLMVGRTLTSLKRNCLDLLEQLVGSANFSYSLSQKEGVLFGRKLYLEGANDIRAEGKIRGMTLSGAYCDEITLTPEDFFSMLLSRLSVAGAKLIGTTNPDNPQHWFKTNYLDRRYKLNMQVYTYLIDDNTTLDPAYVDSLKAEYVGVFYERFILGRWVQAEGLVYPQFEATKHMTAAVPDAGSWYVSIDYGTMNPFSAGLWCVTRSGAVRVREYYYDGRSRKKLKTDEEYYVELEKLIGDAPVIDVVVDPSAASFIEVIRRHGKFRVLKANNDVLDGIRVTSRYLSSGKLHFHNSCESIKKEFGAYSWDEKSGKDAVIKESDHAMDDMRYFCMSILNGVYRW